jgi:RimJ/RimL family protein N-acetyltransferase
MSFTESEQPLILIRGERVGLGPVRRDLIPTYQRWMNTIEVTRTLAAPSHPFTFETEQQWFDSSATERGAITFTIFELPTLRPIGNTGFHVVDHVNDCAEFGIMLGEPDAWGKGYGTEATRLMLHYAFDVLGLHNVFLEVYASNVGAIRAYEKAGFKPIGVRRGAKVVGRMRYDVLYMDAVAGDFEPSHLHHLMNPEQARGYQRLANPPGEPR